MSYQIDYSKFDHDPKRKQREALKDCRQYLGRYRFNRLSKTIQEYLDNGYDIDWTARSLSMIGVQGYPAWAWVEHVAAKRVPVQLKLDI